MNLPGWLPPGPLPHHHNSPRGYGQYEREDVKLTVRCEEVKEAHGSVLASICFVSYILPIYTPEDEEDKEGEEGGGGGAE